MEIEFKEIVTDMKVFLRNGRELTSHTSIVRRIYFLFKIPRMFWNSCFRLKLDRTIRIFGSIRTILEG